MAMTPTCTLLRPFARWHFLPLLGLALILMTADAHGTVLYKNYVVRYDRGWDILCDPYRVQPGDWVLKIFRQKGEIAHDDFREFLGIFERLNPHVTDTDRIRPGQVVDIPLKKLAPGSLPGQSSGVVTIPFVMIASPREMIEKHTLTYTIQQGDTVSQLIANHFGGRFGNTTYSQGLALFKAANPHIADVNRIYAGQKIYMPDPSIREESWYSAIFNQDGELVDALTTEAGPDSPPAAALATARVTDPPQPGGSGGPAAEAAAVIGGRLMDKGTAFLPMQQAKDFELDLSRYPMVDLGGGSKVILTTQDRVMNVDLGLIQSYWDQVKVARVSDQASSQEILEAVLSVLPADTASNRLAFEEGGVAVSVSAKWIRTDVSADGRLPRHVCITPITAASQRTHEALVRYLDRNDIVIKEVLAGTPETGSLSVGTNRAPAAGTIDGSSQKSFVESLAAAMGFAYAPNIAISFPYAGIQVQALSNLLSFGNGRETLIDFGDLYGDAVLAIRGTGLEILQVNLDEGPLELIQRLMESAGLAYTGSPVFYGADRSAEFNTAITVSGILMPTRSAENRLFIVEPLPELIELFIRDQGIQPVQVVTVPG
jgi:hypothetical protein